MKNFEGDPEDPSESPKKKPAGGEMVLFTRTFDLLSWLLPISNHFPRAHRHSFSGRTR